MTKTVWKNLAGIAAAMTGLSASVCLAASPGVFPDRIVLDQSAAFDVPADNQGMDPVFLSVLQNEGSHTCVDHLSRSVHTAEIP